jgi:hypothetical protein
MKIQAMDDLNYTCHRKALLMKWADIHVCQLGWYRGAPSSLDAEELFVFYY